MRIAIGQNLCSLQEAYETCAGKLKCRGVNSTFWETIDYAVEFGAGGRAAFLEQLWHDTDGLSESVTTHGIPVRIV